jgi:hypothetical protein
MPPRDRRHDRSTAKTGRKQRKQPASWPIPPIVQPNAKTLQFSFKHLDLQNPTFPVSACTADFWVALAAKLVEYSQWPVEVFEDQNHEAHRHTIDFAETSEPNGFAHLGMDNLGYATTWQFQVGVDRWRVLGFLLDDVFYVVWLDPNHCLYQLN